MASTKRTIVIVMAGAVLVVILSYLAFKYHQYREAARQVLSSYEWQEDYLQNAPAEIYDAETIDEIEVHLRSKSLSVLGAAVDTLQDIESPDAARILRDLWQGHTARYKTAGDKDSRFDTPLVRLHVAKALCKRDPIMCDECKTYIYTISRTGEILERDLAVSLLSEFRDIDTIHHLERVVLNDQGIPVIGAIRSLSHIGAVRAIPTLEELLRRRLSEDIRIEAERAIFEIRSKSLKDRTDDAASAYIEQLLNSLNSDSCFEAASAVAELSSQHPYLSNDERLTILHGIRDYVQPQVMDKDKTLFDALIAVALWRNGEKEKIEIVFNLLKSSDSHERVNAVTALSLVHIPRTTDALVEIMLHDESPPVVYASVDSLAKVGDLSTVPLLRTAAQRDPENLRDAVQRAVDQIVKREGPSGPEAHTEGAVKLP